MTKPNSEDEMPLRSKAGTPAGTQVGIPVGIHWPTMLQVIVVACLIFFTNLGTAQLWDRDEPRNAGCAVEMLDRGDWVVPIFNGELRAQKPVLLYWLIMFANQVFGVSEFSARFWSALLAVGTVTTTFTIGHRLFGPTVAWLSGIILSSNVMFPVAARAATPDSLLIFLSTLTIAFYVWGSPTTPNQRIAPSLRVLNWRWQLAMGITMGLGLLAKGPVGFLLPMSIMGMHFLIIGRNRQSPRNVALSVIHPIHFCRTTFSMRPLMLLAISLLVALPWYVMVSLRTEGEFLNIFFLKEHLGRSTTVFENHGGGIWFYPLTILIGFFPWSLLWLPVAILVYRDQKTDASGKSAVSLLLCWVGVQVGVFSLVQTKLPSYVTPCYPALSILTAVGLQAWMQKRVILSDLWIKAAMITGVVAGLTIAASIPIAATHYVAKATWLSWLGVIGWVIAISSFIGLWKLRGGDDFHGKDRPLAVVSFATGAICFSWLLFGFGTGSLSTLQNNRRILDRVAALHPEVAVASYECLESSWPFYSKRTIYETFSDAGARPAIRTTDSRRKPVTTPQSFAEKHERCVFITTDELTDQLLQRLPEGYRVQETADYFLKNRTLVLIGK